MSAFLASIRPWFLLALVMIVGVFVLLIMNIEIPAWIADVIKVLIGGGIGGTAAAAAARRAD